MASILSAIASKKHHPNGWCFLLVFGMWIRTHPNAICRLQQPFGSMSIVGVEKETHIYNIRYGDNAKYKRSPWFIFKKIYNEKKPMREKGANNKTSHFWYNGKRLRSIYRGNLCKYQMIPPAFSLCAIFSYRFLRKDRFLSWKEQISYALIQFLCDVAGALYGRGQLVKE